ncbi:MAG: tyrosine-type recombinase/integrase [Lachnospiraceae bacterium]|nr:tyrosine-type recombinase/integrase [Lachnospiraceae bacterium]
MSKDIIKTELRDTSPRQNDLLNYAIENGIIDFDSVHDDYMASKKEQILKNHEFAITPPTETNPRWQTYYRGKDGKRKLLRAQSKEQLIEKLVPIYFSDVLINKMTFEDLFREWLEYKKEVSNSPNTPMRHEQRYLKYLKPSAFNNMSIRAISELMLERESNRIVREFNLSSKEWCNVKTIINGVYKYAIRQGYIDANPMDRVEISVKFRQIVKKTGKTQTYNTEELADLNRYLDEKFSETGDASFMAVKINFLLGLRVGELVALKWDDICDDKHIHIVREEVRDQGKGEVEVVDHTKTHTDRFVILIPKAKDILDKIERQGDYIFMRNGERLTSRQINYVLEKYGERTDQPTKSSHKMRKTYASMLNAKGVPIDAIRELLGHSNLSTTYGYIYNPLTETETYDLVKMAL